MFHHSNFSDTKDEKRPLKYAETIIKTVYNMGEEGLEAFVLSRVSMDTLTKENYHPSIKREWEENFEENLADLATDCTIGLRYIMMWLNEETIIPDAIAAGQLDECSGTPSQSPRSLQLADEVLSLVQRKVIGMSPISVPTTKTHDGHPNAITNVDEYPFEDLHGLYYVAVNGRESHVFTWLITDDTVIYFSTYAGHWAMTLMYVDKKQYFMDFRKAMKGDKLSWPKVFGEEADEDQIGFENMFIIKSRIYE